MQKQSMKFLENLMNSPTPSGSEFRGQEIWRKEIRSFVDTVNGDVHGNSIASLSPKKTPRIMLAGHIDEIGFQVKYIDHKGFIYFDVIGGVEISIIPGRKVKIHTREGEILGVIGRRAVHLIEKAERDKPLKLHDLFFDIGAKNRKDAERLVSIGDPATYDNNFECLRDDHYVSRAFDDKIGAFIVAEVMRNVSKEGNKFKAALFGVATVQEELGLRGAITSAFGIDPHIGIAIDVTHATDTPDVEKKRYGDIQLGQGAVIVRGPNINAKVFERLVLVAKKHRISHQFLSAGKPTGTDANVIQITRAGVATALVSIPCRYMHSCTEIVSIQDVESAIKILTEFCFTIDSKTNFTL